MNPILLEIPEVITTPRLVIRAVRPGDGAMMNEAVLESWDRLAPWMPWARGEKPTAEAAEIRVREGYAKWILRQDLWMCILDRKTGKYLGGTGLHRPNWVIPSLEIGYWIRTQAEGHGFVTESTNAITRFAFDALKCRRVELRCSAKNTRSLAVFDRLGYTFEARLKLADGYVVGAGDSLVYARFDKNGLPPLEVSW